MYFWFGVISALDRVDGLSVPVPECLSLHCSKMFLLFVAIVAPILSLETLLQVIAEEVYSLIESVELVEILAVGSIEDFILEI